MRWQPDRRSCGSVRGDRWWSRRGRDRRRVGAWEVREFLAGRFRAGRMRNSPATWGPSTFHGLVDRAQGAGQKKGPHAPGSVRAGWCDRSVSGRSRPTDWGCYPNSHRHGFQARRVCQGKAGRSGGLESGSEGRSSTQVSVISRSRVVISHGKLGRTVSRAPRVCGAAGFRRRRRPALPAWQERRPWPRVRRGRFRFRP